MLASHRLPRSGRLPGGRDHIGLARALEQHSRGKGEFPIAGIDGIDDAVQVGALFVRCCEEIALILTGARIEGGHLHLQHLFAVPLAIQHEPAQPEDERTVLARRGEPVLCPDPV
jgi:hypothetical protein